MKKVPYSYSTFPNVYWKARKKCDREDSSISKKIHEFLTGFVAGEPEVSVDAQGNLVEGPVPQDLAPGADLKEPLSEPVLAVEIAAGTLNGKQPTHMAEAGDAAAEELPDILLASEEDPADPAVSETTPAQPEQETSIQPTSGLKPANPGNQKKNSQPASKGGAAKKTVANKSRQVSQLKKVVPKKAAAKPKSGKKTQSSKVRKVRK